LLAIRTTYIIKQDRFKEALELAKEDAKRYPDYAKVRCYTSSISPWRFVWELVVENEEAHTKFYADIAGPEFDAFWIKWKAIAENVPDEESWDLTERWEMAELV